jgi:acylphosphatase
MTHCNSITGKVVYMAKRRIIVKGNVQGVGFRAFVRQYAFNMDVKGLVRNLSDKTVEIFCEADEGTLKKFLRAITVKGDKMDPFVINVEQIMVFDEKTKEYKAGKVPRSFKEFIVDYGAGLTKAEREAAERDEYTILAGQRLGQKMDTGFNGLGQKVDVVGKNVVSVGQDVRAMHKDMNEKFTGMEQKYHTINKNIERSDGNIERMTKEISVIAKALLELVESNIKQNVKRAKKT